MSKKNFKILLSVPYKKYVQFIGHFQNFSFLMWKFFILSFKLTKEKSYTQNLKKKNLDQLD